MAASGYHISLPMRLKAFCGSHGISTKGTLALTVQKNRSTLFSSVICDFDSMKIVSHYPCECLTSYNEGRKDDYIYAYHANLDSSKVAGLAYQSTPDVPTAPTTDTKPFCCHEIEPYKPRKLDKEVYFTDFLTSHGTHEDVVYEVKEQVNNGPMLSVKFYTLDKGVISPIEGEFSQKVHAFKNYKCTKHNRFYGIDLYRRDKPGSSTYNYHHMRLNYFTKINPTVLDEFLN